MEIDFNKRLFFLQKKKKISFSYKNILLESFYLYRKNFFFIFFNFFLYYILHEWFVQLAKDYTDIDMIFTNLIKSIFFVKKIEEINYINLEFYYNLTTYSNIVYYFIYLLIIDVLFFPLIIGIYEICLQYEKCNYVDFELIFVGYLDKNFFNFIGLAIIYTILKFLFLIFFVFPFFLFFVYSIFSGPLMFFHNLSIKDSFLVSYKIVKIHFLEIFVFLFFISVICSLISILFVFGVFFITPFFHIIIYVLYKKLMGINFV